MDEQAETPPAAMGPQPKWQEAIDLLASGQYEDAAALLDETRVAADANGHSDLTLVLQAAREICLAGNDFRAEVDHHEQAYEAATRREQQLQQHLQALLNIIAARMGLPGREVNIARSSSPTPAPNQDTEIPGLLSRLQSLLGRNHDARSPDGDTRPSQPPAPVPRQTEEESTAARDSPAESGRRRALPDTVSRPNPTAHASDDRPSLIVYCLGPFRVYQNDSLVTDWNGLRSQLIIKYLVAHKGKPVAKEVLMDVFWPDSDPEAARRNLHQAVYSLRQTLRRNCPNFHHILFENDCYLVNPEMGLWLDFEEFQRHGRTGRRLEASGQRAEAMAEYGVAEGLYQGAFLAEDLYEEWCQWQRKRIRDMYLDISNRLSEYYVQSREYTAAMALCQKVLAQDECHEQAHFRLMRCYLAQHQRHLAVRQYQFCREVLKSELDLEPSEETTALYRRLTS